MVKLSLVSVLLLAITLTNVVESDAEVCSSTEFACDDEVECIPRKNWCDDTPQCEDESDEEYCEEKSFFGGTDPNKCAKTHFLCEDGVCFPKSARCDGQKDCSDGSDEKECKDEISEITTVSTVAKDSKILKSLNSHKNSKTVTKKQDPKDDDDDDDDDSDSSEEDDDDSSEEDEEEKENGDVEKNEVSNEIESYGGHPSAVKKALEKGTKWLMSIRNSNYGWGTFTARALIALGLTNPESFVHANEDVNLMKKQLQILVAMDMLRNRTEPIPLNRLSLYINAMLATCQDPRNLHGMDLVRELRGRTTATQSIRHQTPSFVNPIVYLTLCLVDQIKYNDIYKLLETIRIRAQEPRWHDMQALSIMAFSCIDQFPQYRNSYNNQLQGALNLLLDRVTKGNVSNVYSTALAAQALLATHKYREWNSEPTVQFLISSQRKNGSFGDELATYYILPVLAKKNLVDLKAMPCHISGKIDELMPLDRLRNWQGARHYIRYSLHFGEPLRISSSIELQVPVNTSFFDIMRLAEVDDPKFKFLYEKIGDSINVYSISGIPNDAERGYYWQPYVNLNARGFEVTRHHRHNSNHQIRGSVNHFVPKTGDHVTFWYKSIAT